MPVVGSPRACGGKPTCLWWEAHVPVVGGSEWFYPSPATRQPKTWTYTFTSPSQIAGTFHWQPEGLFCTEEGLQPAELVRAEVFQKFANSFALYRWLYAGVSPS